MIRGIEGINLATSRDNFKKLLDFYTSVVGLKVDFEGDMGEKDRIAGLKIGEGNLYLVTHSDVHGEAHEPERIIINMEVDNIEKEESRLKEKKVKQIEPIYHVEGYGYLSTFEDPDGNYFQIAQVRES